MGKKISIQQRKICNVWYQIKQHQACKEAGKYNPYEEKNRSTETAAKITQMVDKDIKTIIGKCTYMFTAYPQGHKYILLVNPLGMDFAYIHNRSQDSNIYFLLYGYPIGQESLMDKEHLCHK